MIGIAGLSGGQVFRRDQDWRVTSWGAVSAEWPVNTSERASTVPLFRGQLGASEGDDAGIVAGMGGGALLRPGGICGERNYTVDFTLSIRRIAGDTQLIVASRLAYYPLVPWCASP